MLPGKAPTFAGPDEILSDLNAIQSFLATLLLLLLIFALGACQKERFTDDGDVRLRFSTDTLTFDTVFTTVGSTTNFFKIYNPERQALRISNIELGGGGASLFRINVNGDPVSTAVGDVEIGANDSLYVFVEVTVDPSEEDLPFLVTDSILFETNGNLQQIKLVAYGQNANYFSNVAICDETFSNERPYLLYNDILVEAGCTLTLKEGVRMFMHPRSNLYVAGTLIVEGTVDSLVTFEGDRLEDFFDDLPAQWNGIYVLRGGAARIDYARINESTDGLTVGFPFFSEDEILDDRTPQVIINNSIIEHTLSRCLLGLRADIESTNCLFSTSNLYNVELAHGGRYDFRHCTLVNYGGGGITHRDPILRMANYASIGGGLFIGDQLTANFENCLIHGSEDEELLIDNLNEPGALPMDFLFDHCLLKTELNIDTIGFNNCLKNPARADTLFADRFARDFRLNDDSPAIDAGFPSEVTTDFGGQVRDALPDLGWDELGE